MNVSKQGLDMHCLTAASDIYNYSALLSIPSDGSARSGWARGNLYNKANTFAVIVRKTLKTLPTVLPREARWVRTKLRPFMIQLVSLTNIVFSPTVAPYKHTPYIFPCNSGSCRSCRHRFSSWAASSLRLSPSSDQTSLIRWRSSSIIL